MTTARLEAPLLPDEPDAFGRVVEPFRAELVVHAYRMLGSLDDAEDAVQDALVRAWNGRSTFVREGSIRAWLYRIATTASLDAIERRARRGRELRLDVEPAPDAVLGAAGASPGPDARYDARESISLAFLRALQLLPPRQRAALILRDVLGWSAAEIADLLGTSQPAVHSSLQRARATVETARHGASRAAGKAGGLAAVVERYVRAWESADIDGLVALLRSDALLRMPPRPDVRGAGAIAAFIGSDILVAGGPNRLVPVGANDDVTFLVVGPAGVGEPARPFAVLALDVAGGEITGIAATARPSTVARFAAITPWTA
jgi:RNA polymerase sigma factor (sigma-70 family)